MSDKPPRHRFFAESLDGEMVALPPAEARHALDVLRLRSGEVVALFDGAGGVAIGTLQPAGRAAARVEITARSQAGPPPAPAVELAFAVPKGRRLDWLLEKATELAAAALSPVIFERSVARPGLSAHARRRWRRICIAAAKQCGADLLPRIDPPQALADVLARAGQGRRIFGDFRGHLALPDVLEDSERRGRIGVLVGPEGGMTDAERDAAAAAGFTPVRLPGYALRVETAAVALLAAIRAWGQT